MPKTVPYDRQTINTPNPIARFTHRIRFKTALEITSRHCASGASLVDFGAGTGYFLSLVHGRRPDIKLGAVEPYMLINVNDHPYITRVESLRMLPIRSQSIITALEVCEHLYMHELDEFLDETSDILGVNGHLIISVPIMYGLAVVLKEINRMILFRRWPEYSALELVRSVFGRPVMRPVNPKPTHKGFDFRELKRLLKGKYEIQETVYSPFPRLPWWINSQVFFVCQKK